MNQGYGSTNLKAREINLKEYYDLIKKRLWLMILIIILTTLAGYFYDSKYNNYVPLYETSTRIIIGPEAESMVTLMVMIKDPSILEKVIQELELTRTTETLAAQIDVVRLDESRVIQIAVTDEDPVLAANIANETARIFKEDIVSILQFSDVRLLSEAKEMPYPLNEKSNGITIIAFVFGVVVSIGLVFLLDSLDGTLKKDRDVEEILGVPVLGVISNMNRKKYISKKHKNYQDLEIRGETIGVE
ncbi:capsular biosynthesis protein [Aquibacillus halophilus]|uniref:Capsular biosynthesis protein n=1 Tax=Aquibacillus halophilus TaxID=930132 RepID=A0A6A8DAA5_9BACI|nr:capsular biosynthesis protein [Aquibacillus halophilus]